MRALISFFVVVIALGLICGSVYAAKVSDAERHEAYNKQALSEETELDKLMNDHFGSWRCYDIPPCNQLVDANGEE
jgi:hypothetical protein